MIVDGREHPNRAGVSMCCFFSPRHCCWCRKIVVNLLSILLTLLYSFPLRMALHKYYVQVVRASATVAALDYNRPLLYHNPNISLISSSLWRSCFFPIFLRSPDAMRFSFQLKNVQRINHSSTRTHTVPDCRRRRRRRRPSVFYLYTNALWRKFFHSVFLAILCPLRFTDRVLTCFSLYVCSNPKFTGNILV